MKANNISKKSNTKWLILVSFCSSVLFLPACQPTDTDNHSEEPLVEETHDMSVMSNSSEFEQAYMKGMNSMQNEMTSGTQSNDADVAFAKSMLPHHKGAVNMAQVQLKYGKDNIMLKLAEGIIATQQVEIEQMQNWLNTHADSEEQDYTLDMHKSYEESMLDMHNQMMHGLHSSDPDMAFAKGMLAHHKGAVAMAKVQLEYGKDESMRQLAENIIETQQSEIALMRDWIARN